VRFLSRLFFLAAALCPAFLSAAFTTNAPAAAPQVSLLARSFDDDSAGQPRLQEEKLYIWTGEARVISDITHKETWWPGSGAVTAGSRDEAMKMAKEAMMAQGSTGGHVVDAHVSLVN